MSAKLPKGRHWGEVLKKIRKDRNLSQPELGALIEHARGDGERIVYPQHLVGRYERTASPSMHTVEAMLSLLGYKIRLKPLPWPNDEVKAILDARKERAQASRKSVVRSEAPAAADTEALVDEVASDEPGPEPSTESGGSVVPSEPAPEGDSVDKAIEKRQLPKDKLSESEIAELDDCIVLDPAYLDGAILGSTTNAGGSRVLVYEYELLIELYADEEGDPEDMERSIAAQEWVDYTIRALPCMGERAPLIVSLLEDGDEEEMDDTSSSVVELTFGGVTRKYHRHG